MTENEIIIKSADTIDEDVVTLKISTTETVQKRIPKHSLFGFKWGFEDVEETVPLLSVFHIRPATLRTMSRISKELVGDDLPPMPEDNTYLQWVFNAINDNVEKQARILAIAIHNQKSEVPTELVDFILDSFTATDLFKVIQAVIDKLNIIPFMNTITSTKSIQVLKTEQVSPIENEEIIASGEQSEVLSSILGSATIIP